MQFSLFSRKALLAVLMVSFVSTNSSIMCATQADSMFSLNTIKQLLTSSKVKNTALFLAFLALFRFYMKDASNVPARTNWKKVWDKIVATVSNPANLTANTPELLNELWYALDDLVIGRAYESSSLKADKDSGKIIVKEGGKPQGIGGQVHAHMKPLKNAALVALALKIYLEASAKDGAKVLDDKANNQNAQIMLAALLAAFGLSGN